MAYVRRAVRVRLADVNNNGKFDVNNDFIVKIAGGAAGTVVIGDFIFS